MFKRKRIEVRLDGKLLYRDLIDTCLKTNRLVDDVKEEMKSFFKGRKLEFIVK